MRSVVVIVALLGGTLARNLAAMGTEELGQIENAAASTGYSEAVRLIEVEDYSGAVALLEGVVALVPDHANAWSRLGFSHRKLGLHDKALAAYGEALRLQPGHLGANEYLGELYIETGKLDLAKERLAVLADACDRSCEEYAELKELIDAAEGGAK